MIEHLRKSIPEAEARIRQMKRQNISGASQDVKEVWGKTLESFERNLAHDIRDLKQFEEWRNEEMKQKFNKKKMNNLIGVSGGIRAGKDLVGQMIQYIGDELNTPTFERFEDYIGNNKYRIQGVQKYQIKKCADKLKDCVCLILGCTREQLEDRGYKNQALGEAWKVWKFTYDMDANLFDGVCQLTDIIFSSKEDAEDYIAEYKIINADEIYSEYLTPRKILQLLGTEGGRMVIHPNIWVNALFADYYDGETLARASGFSQKTDPSNWIITDVRFPENEGKAVTDRGGLLIGIRRHFGLRFPDYAFREIPDDPYAIPSMLMNDDEPLFDMLMHESEIKMGDHSWCDVVIENNGTVEDLFNEVLKAVYYKKELV